MQNRKKKIIFLDHTPFFGGAQLSLVHHLQNLNKKEYDIMVVCSERAESLGFVDMYKKANVSYRFINLERLKIFNPIVIVRFLRSYNGLRRIIKKENPDLIVCNTVRTAIIGSIVSFLNHKKCVWFIRDYTFPLGVFLLFSFFADKIIFNARDIGIYYDKYLLKSKKKEIVYIGRDFYKEVEKVNVNDIVILRKEFGVVEGDVCISYIGRLVKWKGPQVMIEAAKKLVDNGVKNIKFFIVGTGAEQIESNEMELRKVVFEAGLEDKIIFTGFRKDIPELMSLSDVFVLTSIDPEPFSSTVIEAMMSKTFVIGTDIGGTPEIIREKETGLLVTPGSGDDLQKAIEYFLANREKGQDIVNNAYKHVMKFHTAGYTTRQIEQIYKKLLESSFAEVLEDE